MSLERRMGRSRDARIRKDMKLLERYSLGDHEAFVELRKRYFATPYEKRAAAMREIERYAKATAFLVHREMEAQGKKN